MAVRYGTRISLRRRDIAALRPARPAPPPPEPVVVTPEPEPEPEPEPIDYASMTVSELKALAALVHGLDVPSRIRKADLIELIKTSI